MTTFHVNVTLIIEAEHAGDAQGLADDFCKQGFLVNENWETMQITETLTQEPIECVTFGCSECGYQWEDDPEDREMWCPRCGKDGPGKIDICTCVGCGVQWQAPKVPDDQKRTVCDECLKRNPT